MSAIDITRESQRLTQLRVDAKTLWESMEANAALRTTDNVEKLDKMLDDGMKTQTRIDSAKSLNAFDPNAPAARVGAGGSEVPPPAGGDGGAAQPFTGKSWGQRVVDSEQFQTATKRWTDGKLESVKVGDAKAVTSTPASGGYMYRPDRQAEIVDIARMRPFSVLDVIGQGQTAVDAVEYVEMSSRTINAQVVPELDAARVHVATADATETAIDRGNYQENFAMKPKGDIAFALKTALVKTVAEWIAASRQILADAPRLRGTIDDELTYVLRLKLEDMVVAANETGFVGILPSPGIQQRTHRVAGRAFKADDNIADTLRRALTDIQLAFYEADAIMVSPQVAEALELEKDNYGQYLKMFDPVRLTIWRVRVVISNALNGANAGTAIAGNFAMGAKLWDRMDVEIRTGEPGNFFLQNAIAILGEIRAAFAVQRPLCFEKILALI